MILLASKVLMEDAICLKDMVTMARIRISRAVPCFMDFMTASAARPTISVTIRATTAPDIFVRKFVERIESSVSIMVLGYTKKSASAYIICTTTIMLMKIHGITALILLLFRSTPPVIRDSRKDPKEI